MSTCNIPLLDCRNEEQVFTSKKKNPYQSSKDNSKREPRHGWDLRNTPINVRGLVSCCNSWGPWHLKGHKIAIAFSTSTVRCAIHQLASLEN